MEPTRGCVGISAVVYAPRQDRALPDAAATGVQESYRGNRDGRTIQDGISRRNPSSSSLPKRPSRKGLIERWPPSALDRRKGSMLPHTVEHAALEQVLAERRQVLAALMQL